MTREEFVGLLHTMGEGWNTLNAEMVADCFTHDVLYTDPLHYRFISRAELLSFFALPPGETQAVI